MYNNFLFIQQSLINYLEIYSFTSNKLLNILNAILLTSLSGIFISGTFIAFIPAFTAAFTPNFESSITIHSLGSTFKFSAAFKNISGLGLELTISFPHII